jgi:hypothetical protein
MVVGLMTTAKGLCTVETSRPNYLPQLSRLLSGSEQSDVSDLQSERAAIGPC